MRPGEGEPPDVLPRKKISQLQTAVWCKGRIQVLVEVAAVKVGRPRPLGRCGRF